MIRTIIVSVLLLMVVILFSCKGPEGPVGPAGSNGASLNDPSIMPKVIYTFPPKNSQGPYFEFYPAYYSQIQLRFNKYMDLESVRHAINISSSSGDVRADTNYISTTAWDLFSIYTNDALGNRISRWRVGQNYTFKVASSAHDINGNSLSQPFTMTFMPEPYFRIAQINPDSGTANVSLLYANIMIDFNSPVDTSILSKIHIIPPLEHAFGISSDSLDLYSYIGPNTLKNGTTYTIKIDSIAHDKYDNVLPKTFISTFTTSPFDVSSTIPGNNQNGISLSQYIEVFCTGLIDPTTVESAFHIEPGIKGILGLCQQCAYFTFNPIDNYIPDTFYTVTVDTSLRSQDGARLPDPYIFSFRTQPFKVYGVSPSDGQTSVYPFSSINIVFNGYIDTGSVRSSFSLYDSLNVQVSGYFRFDYGSNTFVFISYSSLKTNAMYRIVVTTDMRSKGGFHLKYPFSSIFTTGS